jgi:hypothetical protein
VFVIGLLLTVDARAGAGVFVIGLLLTVDARAGAGVVAGFFGSVAFGLAAR